MLRCHKNNIIFIFAVVFIVLINGCIMRSQVQMPPNVSATMEPETIIIYDPPIQKSEKYYEVSYDTVNKIHKLIPAEQYYGDDNAVG